MCSSSPPPLPAFRSSVTRVMCPYSGCPRAPCLARHPDPPRAMKPAPAEGDQERQWPRRCQAHDTQRTVLHVVHDSLVFLLVKVFLKHCLLPVCILFCQGSCIQKRQCRSSLLCATFGSSCYFIFPVLWRNH